MAYAENLQTTLEKRLEEGRESGCFPAAAAAAGVRREILARAFAGEAPLPGDNPVDESTRFDMASLSKVLGPTMIVLKALESGQLRLEDRIGDFFPDAPEDKRDITLFMLLTHTAGFKPFFRLDSLGIRPADAARAILDSSLEVKPGVRPIYSCMGFILLAKILERHFGQPLDVLSRERVFKPLGMAETGYRSSGDAICAATELDPATGSPLIGVVHDENARFLNGVSGNAGVFMPLGDGIRFAQMLADGGGDFLSRDTLAMATRNYTPGKEQHRGLGFQLAGTPDCFFSAAVPDRTFGHTGFTGTSLLVEPESGFWVLLLTNRVCPTRENTRLFPFRRRLHADLWAMR